LSETPLRVGREKKELAGKSAMGSKRFKCSGIPYRQGWIEVTPAIHDGYVNFEVWKVSPEIDISPPASELSLLTDAQVIGSAEVELSVARAKELVKALEDAIKLIESRGDQPHSCRTK
jgi:hypothetical protein